MTTSSDARHTDAMQSAWASAVGQRSAHAVMHNGDWGDCSKGAIGGANRHAQQSTLTLIMGVARVSNENGCRDVENEGSIRELGITDDQRPCMAPKSGAQNAHD